MDVLSNGYFLYLPLPTGQLISVFVAPNFQLNLLSADLIRLNSYPLKALHLSLHDVGCGYLVTRAMADVSLGIGKYYFEVKGLVSMSIVPEVSAILGRDFHEMLHISKVSKVGSKESGAYKITTQPFRECVLLDCKTGPDGFTNEMLFTDCDYSSKFPIDAARKIKRA